jgi:predicted transcriptional regulator of viral defense system
MKYKEFKSKIRDFPIFSSSQINSLTSNAQVLKNQLTLWQKQGLVLRLKRELYILNEGDRKINPSRTFIANQLVSPSYISTEYALFFYGLIPEKVEDITSITTKKTTLIRNGFGAFRYQHLNATCFIGFEQVKEQGGFSFFIATPEKAVVDFLYLNLSNFKPQDQDIFKFSYRFQNTQGLRKKRLRDFAKIFNNQKLIKVVDSFCEFMKSGE